MEKQSAARWGAALLAAAALPFLISACATRPSGPAPGAVSWSQKLFAWPGEIDYSSPGKYLKAGPLTSLSRENAMRLEAAVDAADRGGKGWKAILGIYDFMLDGANFTSVPGGGRSIARRTADRMFEDRTLTGCHDFGIVLAACLRHIGIPAVYVDTASAPWAEAYAAGNRNAAFGGHIFIEAWMDGRWVLLNSTKPYALAEYRTDDPFFGSGVGPEDRYYVMFKGLDPADYGVREPDDLGEAMKAAAERISAETANRPAFQIQRPIGKIMSRTGGSFLDAVILGARAPTERFSARFGGLFEVVQSMGFSSASSRGVSAVETAVCLHDLSRPRIPSYYQDFFKDLSRPDVSPGVYRYSTGRALRLLIVGRNEENLLELIDALDPDALKR